MPHGKTLEMKAIKGPEPRSLTATPDLNQWYVVSYFDRETEHYTLINLDRDVKLSKKARKKGRRRVLVM
jgi:hypothetical protein